MSTRQLPPLNALRAFEATARLRSFTAAARELRVTPAAISHQVKTLEEHLNTSLFHRRNRSVTLTPASRRGLQSISHGFELLLEGVERLAHSQASPVLNLSVSPSFAISYLIQWLPEFHTHHPDIDVRISTLGRQGDGDVDDHAVLRLGVSPDQECQSTELFNPNIQVWSHPLWREQNAITGVESVLSFPLLNFKNHARIGWQEWLLAMGVPVSQLPQTSAQVEVNLSDVAEGKGVILASAEEVAADASGSVLQPLFCETQAAALQTPAYYLYHDKYSENLEKLDVFKSWLLAQTGQLALAS